VHGLQLPGRFLAREYRSGWKYFRLPPQLLSTPTHFNVRFSVFWSGGAPPPSATRRQQPAWRVSLPPPAPYAVNVTSERAALVEGHGFSFQISSTGTQPFVRCKAGAEKSPPFVPPLTPLAHATPSVREDATSGQRKGNKIKFASMYYRAAGSRKVHTTSICRLFPADALCIFNVLVVLVTRHSSADAPAERYPGPAHPVDRVEGAEDVSDAVSTDAEVRSEVGD
jgi:hypothetical protein